MSGFENYNKKSADYGKIRCPIGIEIIIGALARYALPRKLEELHLLDVGCGAGVYLAPLSNYLKKVVGLDLSSGQLMEAEKRLINSGASNFSLINSDARALPFEESSFDAVLICLVLHHLCDKKGSPLGIEQALEEVCRVLKPGGVFILGYCTTEQVLDGAWYCRLLKDASRKLSNRHPDFSWIREVCYDAGLELLGRHVPLDGVLQGEDYFNYLGPLDPHWRNADSLFSLVSSEELEGMEIKLRELKSNGELEGFMKEHEIHRLRNGHLTFGIFRKKGAPLLYRDTIEPK